MNMFKNRNRILKSFGKVFAFAIFYILYSAFCLYADFEDLGAGARAMGMGNAFSALADDPFGFYYNPAGPAFIYQGQIGADYGKLWTGLDDNSELPKSFIALTLPFVKSEMIEVKNKVDIPASAFDKAASTASVKSQKQMIYTHRGTFSAGWRSFALVDCYEESTYYLGYSRSYKRRWAWGVNAKVLQEKYKMDAYLAQSPVFSNGGRDSLQAYSVDAGFMYNLMPRLFVGISGSDINQPNTGLLEEDCLPAVYRLGVGWRQKDIRWAVDFISRSGALYTAAGFEKRFGSMLAARGGLQFGGKNYLYPGLGFSFNMSAFQIDYVFHMPLIGVKETGGSHQMSFVYRFGNRPVDELEPGSLEFYYSRLQEEAARLKLTLLQTEGEKKKLEEILIEEATLRIKERIRSAKTEAKESKSSSLEAKETKEIRHLVQKGETLQSIAEKYYKDAKYWNEIYQANRDSVGRGGALKPNQILIIPPLARVGVGSQPSSEDLPSMPVLPGLPARQGGLAPIKVITITPQPGAESTAQEKTEDKPSIEPIMQPVPIKIITPEKESKEQKQQPKAQPAPKEKPAQKSPRKHVVQPGESLQSLAQKYYNDKSRWKEIYEANKDKVISGQIMPGKEITIP